MIIMTVADEDEVDRRKFIDPIRWGEQTAWTSELHRGASVTGGNATWVSPSIYYYYCYYYYYYYYCCYKYYYYYCCC